MTTYYLGKTKAGDLVARASTRSDYTHVSVEQQSIRWESTQKDGTYNWRLPRHKRGRFVPGEMVVHGGVVALGRCHFSTSEAGAMALARNYHQAGAKVEVVEVMQVDAKVYRATLKDFRAFAD